MNANYVEEKLMKKYLAGVLVAILGASGCATTTRATAGRMFDDARISEIKKGRTTKQEVLAMFGEPHSKKLDTEGTEQITYFHSESKDTYDPRMFIPFIGFFFLNSKTDSRSKTLDVVLKSGVVSDFSYDESGAPGKSAPGAESLIP
jgi:hypothetical protein